MNLSLYLKKEKIASRETLVIFVATLLVYVLSWFYWKTGFIPMTYGFLLIALGGICNLYVISYNDCKMPVLAKSELEFKEFKKRNPKRGICILNSKIRLKWLADRFPIRNMIFSIGDFSAIIGLILCILQLFLKIIKI